MGLECNSDYRRLVSAGRTIPGCGGAHPADQRNPGLITQESAPIKYRKDRSQTDKPADVFVL